MHPCVHPHLTHTFVIPFHYFTVGFPGLGLEDDDDTNELSWSDESGDDDDDDDRKAYIPLTVDEQVRSVKVSV